MGPWVTYTCEGGRYWRVIRRNPIWVGGIEVLRTHTGRARWFMTYEAARKAARKANAKAKP